MTKERCDIAATVLVSVVLRIAPDRLALWEAARGIDREAMAWVCIGRAKVVSDDEIEVMVSVPEERLGYLETILGPEYASSALEEEITDCASGIYDQVRLEEEFLALNACVETDLPAGAIVVPLSLEDISELGLMIAESEGDVGRVALWRTGEADGAMARVGVLFPPELQSRMEALVSTEERAEDPGGAVIRTILEALREESGGTTGNVVEADDGVIPF